MTTVDLAHLTAVHPDLLRQMLDAGLFRGVVRLVRGRPAYTHEAVAVVREALKLGEDVATGALTAVEAWFRLHDCTPA